ncbi:hypothetical protein HELRODRAFT_160409 [Helobdella robusta]|uniref:HAT C-terminal dimerisation domain-containing protein n=1 Tax=Helobdella robusta TaxID=6412 RepID=T1EQ78_HELRO|nr:hypothetical protein HELRODRAFT_160409 [Helobdella robusta]ESO06249.1 hypothetical protein HELRODRAFT_160409 [Helobdella robusta]
MSKRKSVYREQFSTDFPGIKNSKKGENYAFCEYCSTDVSIANAGVSSIKQHFEKEVHKNNVKIKKSTVGISTFFHSNNLPTSRKTAAAEGAFAYHVAFHSLSFKAADCTNRLISTVFAESETGRKFSSAQTKTQTIISRILAPKSTENLLSELGSEPFSIATDSSNFKEIKTFPIIIRYFSHEGLKVELLEFSNLPEETMQKNFFGAMTQSKLQSLEDSNLANRIEKEFSTFYSTSVDYIQKWFRITDYPSSSKWLMLKSVDTISYEDIRKSAEFLMPEISVKDSLFDETSLLISLLKDSKESFHELPIDIKWAVLFQNELFLDLKKLVYTIFAIPTSNAAVERIFSLCKKQWTEDRNCLKIDTVKSLLQARVVRKPTDRLTDRPSENRPLVVRKPIRLDGQVKTGQGCAKADRLTDRPSENRPWIL